MVTQACRKPSVIQDNYSKVQQKIISFSRMVTNAVMFHTVANTTNVLNQLSGESIQYNKEDLSIISAYFRGNINRYGVFELSRSKDRTPLELAIKGA
jgi:Tn3 transposase DDE domain